MHKPVLIALISFADPPTGCRMSTEEATKAKAGDLDLLKSILESDQANDAGFASSSLSNSGRSSKMADCSTPSEDHVHLNLPASSEMAERPRTAKGSRSRRKEVTNIRSDSDFSDYPESSRSQTIHLQHGMNYTPLTNRSQRSPRKVASAQRVQNTGDIDPLAYKYAELQALLSNEGPNKKLFLDPNLTRKARQIMWEHKLAQSGHIPMAWLNSKGFWLPNIEKSKGKGRKSKFPKALFSARHTLNFNPTLRKRGTQGEMCADEDQGESRLDSLRLQSCTVFSEERLTFAEI